MVKVLRFQPEGKEEKAGAGIGISVDTLRKSWLP